MLSTFFFKEKELIELEFIKPKFYILKKAPQTAIILNRTQYWEQFLLC